MCETATKGFISAKIQDDDSRQQGAPFSPDLTIEQREQIRKKYGKYNMTGEMKFTAHHMDLIRAIFFEEFNRRMKRISELEHAQDRATQIIAELKKDLINKEKVR
ncbi:hypothetical protein KIN20_035069 [Parelaphostrongylus tenuis]|uniref:Uncharacterized protein n=1 Tax=Parelaphostrongylus tenuis TaxID=148309 RepID=A0AAD5WK72_PARTN|nr:hypothetical protein KIN20_035069 [Parelaphostrongylus tenuis]